MLIAFVASACPYSLATWQGDGQTGACSSFSSQVCCGFQHCRLPQKRFWGPLHRVSLISGPSKSKVVFASGTPFYTLCKQFTFFTGKAEHADMQPNKSITLFWKSTLVIDGNWMLLSTYKQWMSLEKYWFWFTEGLCFLPWVPKNIFALAIPENKSLIKVHKLLLNSSSTADKQYPQILNNPRVNTYLAYCMLCFSFLVWELCILVSKRSPRTCKYTKSCKPFGRSDATTVLEWENISVCFSNKTFC